MNSEASSSPPILLPLRGQRRPGRVLALGVAVVCAWILVMGCDDAGSEGVSVQAEAHQIRATGLPAAIDGYEGKALAPADADSDLEEHLARLYAAVLGNQARLEDLGARPAAEGEGEAPGSLAADVPTAAEIAQELSQDEEFVAAVKGTASLPDGFADDVAAILMAGADFIEATRGERGPEGPAGQGGEGDGECFAALPDINGDGVQDDLDCSALAEPRMYDAQGRFVGYGRYFGLTNVGVWLSNGMQLTYQRVDDERNPAAPTISQPRQVVAFMEDGCVGTPYQASSDEPYVQDDGSILVFRQQPRCIQTDPNTPGSRIESCLDMKTGSCENSQQDCEGLNQGARYCELVEVELGAPVIKRPSEPLVWRAPGELP